jgi:hypothetical protein
MTRDFRIPALTGKFPAQLAESARDCEDLVRSVIRPVQVAHLRTCTDAIAVRLEEPA